MAYNAREKFIEVLQNFNPRVPSLKWEFGYWGKTLNNWYASGLPKNNFVPVPDKYTSTSSSIYMKSWTCGNPYVAEGEYPAGFVLMAGGLYYPTQGFGLDRDVRKAFHMDKSQQLVDVNLFFQPMFDIEVLEETDDMLKYRDLDGVIRIFLKESATMASGWKWPITDRASWEKLKEERLRPDNLEDRLPKDWAEKVKEYRLRDYPLGLGGYPLGLFGTLAHLIGYEELFFMYYDDPELVHDILNTFTNLWIAVFEMVLAEVDVDHMQIWEDISFGSGCMLPMGLMREFMLPYYQRLTGFLKEHGVKIILVDTDGDCSAIIPFFIEAGATGMYPFEVHCGMDVMRVRKEYPNLAILGGIPKSEIQYGPKKIDDILKSVPQMLKTGGYIPFGDHFIPPEVDFENFKTYRNKLNDMIDSAANI